MKNSRLSDRELARKIGVSQPTITRTRKKLEKEGYIKEYTMIPDFNRLGYEIMAISFVKMRKTLSQEEVEKARKQSAELSSKSSEMGPFNVIMAERGIGLSYDGIFISLHENYESYVRHNEWLSQFAFFEAEEGQSFLVSLRDKVRYLPLTFHNISKHLLSLMTTKGKVKKGVFKNKKKA
jgi:DNA-binding Lrp family transcriptional regulator